MKEKDFNTKFVGYGVPRGKIVYLHCVIVHCWRSGIKRSFLSTHFMVAESELDRMEDGGEGERKDDISCCSDEDI